MKKRGNPLYSAQIPSFYTSLDQVLNILFPNILLEKKRISVDQGKTFISETEKMNNFQLELSPFVYTQNLNTQKQVQYTDVLHKA